MLNWHGILIGAISFLSIGIFHPIVIKAEYHFSYRCWPVFLVIGLILLGISTVIKGSLLPCIFAVTGFSCLWSIYELFEQKKRVDRGWFPKKECRKKKKE